ncbi:hypothetical protein AALP_AA8G233600 [Arabis alpina]|uniref:Uncharacterized protein n=1 Tax=Arabis alpina TaxID=50452 RepID=A0A087G8X7_ARAAL|nr:hypothetical protein AALP_AA8G233600 [Arabis alpina]
MDEIHVMKNNDSHEDLDKKDLILVLNLGLELPCVTAEVSSILLFNLLVLLSVLADETFCFCTNPKEASLTTSNNEDSDSDGDVVDNDEDDDGG